MLLKKILGPNLGGKNDIDTKPEKLQTRGPLQNISNSLIDDTDEGTSCTTAFSTAALEIQQKLKRKKSKRSERNNAPNNELAEISEEYDIQTIVSGLTRNSEFQDRRDPPTSKPSDDNVLDRSQQWPDDETHGHNDTCGHHVISIMDGNQVTSKDTVRCDQGKLVSRNLYENKKVAMSEPRGARIESTTKETVASKLEKIKQKESSVGYEILLAVEPDGVKLKNGKPKIPIEPSGKKIESFLFSCTSTTMSENPRSNASNKNPRRRSHTLVMNDRDVEVVYQDRSSDLSEQSEGKTSRRRSKSTNAERRKSTSKYHRKNPNEKSRDESHSSSEGKRRSRSLPRTLKRITSRYRRGEGSEAKGEPSPSRETYDPPPSNVIPPPFINNIVGVVETEIISTLGSNCEGIESLTSKRKDVETMPVKYSHATFSPPPCEAICETTEPRVCVEFSRRKSGGYFQTTCYSGQKTSDKSASFNKKKRNVVDSSPRHQKVETRIPVRASTLEYPRHETEMLPRQETRAVQKLPRTEGRLSQRNSRVETKTIDEKSEILFPEQVFPDDENERARSYHQMETKTPDEASKIVFPHQNVKAVETLPDNFAKKNNRKQITAIVEEASRNSLLTPKGKDDSFVENEDIFEKFPQISHHELLPGRAKFVAESHHQSVPVTPTPEKMLRQEFSGRKTTTSVEDPNITLLSMTPAGRKDLIQRYLNLRQKQTKLEASMVSRDHELSYSSQRKNVSCLSNGSHSVGSVYIEDDNSIVEDSSISRGDNCQQRRCYDDASRYYQRTRSSHTQQPGAISERIQGTNTDYLRERSSDRLGAVPSASDHVNARRSSSESYHDSGTQIPVEATRIRGNQFSAANINKHKNTERESWTSPTLVTSHPYSQPEYSCTQQDKLSYSYASDDSSTASSFAPQNMFDTYNPNLNKPYTFPPSNYEEQLRPHNQFMRMQMGIGNR